VVYPSDPSPSGSIRDLASFSKAEYDKGRPKWVQATWFVTMNLFFSPWWVPASLRVAILRVFGADMGNNILIRHRVRVLWPWKLRVGDNSWIGEGAWLLNLEAIDIGRNVCISQEAMLCTGGHNHRAASFDYENGPITIHDGAWVGARAIVLPGTVLGIDSVVGAGTVASKDIPANSVVLRRSDIRENGSPRQPSSKMP
jgi:putative colanic acid biosynthesis acetyltransferase WcaF